MKIVKYLFVGGVAAIVDLSIFVIFAKILGYNYLIIGTISFVTATAVNYILSIKFVFKSGTKHKRHKEIILVYIISGIGLLLNLTGLYLFISKLHIEMITSKIAVSFIVFFWNYFMRKYYVF